MINFSDYILNISNLKYNLKAIKGKVGLGVKVCAMVKADAYGHGIKDVCKALKGVDFFGVASVYEAMQIRKFDKYTNVLVVGASNLEYVNWCAINNVSIAISSIVELECIYERLVCSQLKVHIKVNTGLNRIGVSTIREYKQILRFIKLHSNILLEGVFTHFATKMDDLQFLLKQHSVFLKYVDLIDRDKVIVHCSNSFASIMFPCFSFDMVRCGFNLYGWQLDYGVEFKPVLNIESKIVFIQNVKKGSTIGYDRTYFAGRNMRVAIVPIGYADGLDRGLSNNFSLIVNNQKAKIVGNICMDVCMLDVTDVKCEVGDKVIVLGDYDGIRPSDYALAISSSPYEVLLKFKYNRMNRIIN